MIRRSGKDGDGAVDLFGQHGAGERVGPGLHAEGDGLAGFGNQRRVEAVGPPDDEGEVPNTVIAQAGDFFSESPRGQGLAAFVAGDEAGLAGLGAQGLGLRALAGFSGFNLDDGNRAKAQRAAADGGPFGIIAGKGGFSAAAQAADGDQANLQETPAARWRESTAQIFSIL